jgi:HEAT repeat protein
LISYLEGDASYKVRIQAVISLARVRERLHAPSEIDRVMLVLRRALRADRNSLVRAVTAAALGHLRDQDAGTELQQALTREPSPLARKQMANALERIQQTSLAQHRRP